MQKKEFKKSLLMAVAGLVVVAWFMTLRDSPESVGTMPQAGTPVAFTKVAKGQYSTVMERVNYIVTTRKGLVELWELVDESVPQPEIDFTKNAAIAVFAGAVQTAGYSIGVVGVHDTDKRTVSIQISKPAPGCVTAQVGSAPFELLVIPATTLPFTHQDIEVTTPCN